MTTPISIAWALWIRRENIRGRWKVFCENTERKEEREVLGYMRMIRNVEEYREDR